jgi:hypothetical protein
MIDYTIDETRRLIRVRMHGSVTCTELERHYAEAYHDPKYNSSLRSLVHIDDDAGGPILTELPRVRTVLELAAQSPGALKKWAVVLRPGFKRMVLEFLLKDARVRPLEMRFFDDEPTALAWLDSN